MSECGEGKRACLKLSARPGEPMSECGEGKRACLKLSHCQSSGLGECGVQRATAGGGGRGEGCGGAAALRACCAAAEGRRHELHPLGRRALRMLRGSEAGHNSRVCAMCSNDDHVISLLTAGKGGLTLPADEIDYDGICVGEAVYSIQHRSPGYPTFRVLITRPKDDEYAVEVIERVPHMLKRGGRPANAGAKLKTTAALRSAQAVHAHLRREIPYSSFHAVK